MKGVMRFPSLVDSPNMLLRITALLSLLCTLTSSKGTDRDVLQCTTKGFPSAWSETFNNLESFGNIYCSRLLADTVQHHSRAGKVSRLCHLRR
ncbi:hypothetical protein F5148DRAFT_129729 [Russula earlei]|uniref:Uncharacterized protein n=1 Tax=Russula earlei TaxID=71964 RepID=A0ACC0UKD5_9AGAM|nr:hypothetical protein F5148DRAFT_129729 [Russula earlei]